MNFNHSFFSCDTCEYVADTKHSLKEHTAAEHDGVQCSYAGSRSKVYEHKKIKHEGVRYPCSECDYKAGCLCNLRQHTESTHKGVRYYFGQCQSSFSGERSLKRHKRTLTKVLGILVINANFRQVSGVF